MRIHLEKEMETLLIPLYGRAQMSRQHRFKDLDAERAIEQIVYDFSRLKIQRKTQVMLSLRSGLIDDFTLEYLKAHPESPVLYLGCGLDARESRLNHPAKRWYDLDFPQVIAIKQKLYAESSIYRYIPSSVTDWNWLDQVEPTDQPVLIIAEGLLMYLHEQDVRALLKLIQNRFAQATLICDAYSHLTAKHAKNHPSLKRTGASIHWGVDSPLEIEAYGAGIKHVKTLYLTDVLATQSLTRLDRLLFGLADQFKVAREAHRIFVLALEGIADC